jgi:hypothetical protein
MSLDLRISDVLQPDGRGERLGPEGRVGSASRAGWIVSPWFDILFFSNIYWVLAFLPIYASPDGEPYIHFWMAYFLATPHRWLTLVVAVSDRDRRYGQTWLFIVIAAVVAVVIGAVWRLTGDFRSLFLFYTLLLGWHFAGQHRLVLKIYSGQSGAGVAWMERWFPLIFVVYANVRLVAFLAPIFRLPSLDLLKSLDLAMMAMPAAMLAVELRHLSLRRLPKLLYMVSFFGMWSAVLWTAHWHQDVLCAVLLGAVTVYHSVEYLAMVSYYAWHRREGGSAGLFQTMARNWTVVFAWYVIGCGLLYSFGNAFFVVICYAVNTWASILHCAYDGMMWRYRDPATAEILGIESRGTAEPAPTK